MHMQLLNLSMQLSMDCRLALSPFAWSLPKMRERTKSRSISPQMCMTCSPYTYSYNFASCLCHFTCHLKCQYPDLTTPSLPNRLWNLLILQIFLDFMNVTTSFWMLRACWKSRLKVVNMQIDHIAVNCSSACIGNIRTSLWSTLDSAMGK